MKNKLKPKSKLKTNQVCHKHKNQKILDQNISKSREKTKNIKNIKNMSSNMNQDPD